jgi:4-phospho-D-threonate 3-dehydrogenase / 4-phospho-D-erythronate 3-dehydrogenase
MVGAIKKRIALTVGDMAGIGPEVVLKAVASPAVIEACTPVIICHADTLKATAEHLGLKYDYPVISREDAILQANGPMILDSGEVAEPLGFGVARADYGRAAGHFIETAVDLWKKGLVDAISTAPLNKQSLSLGGYDFPGHTEMLANLTGTEKFAMSFFAGDLRVVLVSTHLPLKEAVDKIKREPLGNLIRFTSKEVSKLIGRQARVAVSGVNPHASENGMFGDEEAREMIPAIEDCRAEGIDVTGPHSADTVFLRGFRGEFDAVIACYHDQATIAVKCLSFGAAVNVTLGLPLIRTSVDHGTAFDIAGKGIAEAESMKTAILLAAQLAEGR